MNNVRKKLVLFSWLILDIISLFLRYVKNLLRIEGGKKNGKR